MRLPVLGERIIPDSGRACFSEMLASTPLSDLSRGFFSRQNSEGWEVTETVRDSKQSANRIPRRTKPPDPTPIQPRFRPDFRRHFSRRYRRMANTRAGGRGAWVSNPLVRQKNLFAFVVDAGGRRRR